MQRRSSAALSESALLDLPGQRHRAEVYGPDPVVDVVPPHDLFGQGFTEKDGTPSPRHRAGAIAGYL